MLGIIARRMYAINGIRCDGLVGRRVAVMILHGVHAIAARSLCPIGRCISRLDICRGLLDRLIGLCLCRCRRLRL